MGILNADPDRVADGIEHARDTIVRSGPDDPERLRQAADMVELGAVDAVEMGYARGLRIVAACMDDEEVW